MNHIDDEIDCGKELEEVYYRRNRDYHEKNKIRLIPYSTSIPFTWDCDQGSKINSGRSDKGLMPKEEEDPDIAIIKARKMKVMREQAAELEKTRIQRQRLEESKMQHKRSKREIISYYLYDRGEEVLKLAESQFPVETKSLVNEIVELIRMGEIKQRISGGELLALFRSVGINVRINTTIKIEDHGKLVSFADKLKQGNQDIADE